MNRLKLIIATISISLIFIDLFAGFIDPNAPKKSDDRKVMNVSDVAGMKEGADICLEGNITREVDKDYYIFKDNTGEIKVKISKSVWGKTNITPDHTARIIGKVYNNSSLSRQRHTLPEIKVKKIELVKETTSS